MTDRHGNTWTITPQGPTAVMLTRPGAVKFASRSELDAGSHESKRETKWHDGLEYRPDSKAWVRA
jgi:hypothetical protein